MFCKPRLAVVGSAVAMVLTLGLSACQADSEAPAETSASPSVSPTTSPSPSTSPTPEDPAEAAKAKNVAEAKQRYLEYQDITSKYAKRGENPFWELMSGGYIGSAELQDSEQSYWEQFTELKLKETGPAGSETVEVVEVTKYEGDPLKKDVTGQRVYMNVCIDNSGRDVVRPDGTSAVQKGGPDRVLMKAVMQGQKQEGIWSLNENASTGKKC